MDFDFENFDFLDFVWVPNFWLGPGMGPPTWARLGPSLGPTTWARLGPTHVGPSGGPYSTEATPVLSVYGPENI